MAARILGYSLFVRQWPQWLSTTNAHPRLRRRLYWRGLTVLPECRRAHSGKYRALGLRKLRVNQREQLTRLTDAGLRKLDAELNPVGRHGRPRKSITVVNRRTLGKIEAGEGVR